MGAYQGIEFSNIKGTFLAKYELRKEGLWSTKIANVFDDLDGEDSVLTTLGGMGPMQEWVGERQVLSPEALKLTVTKKKYSNAIDIPRDSFRRSNPLWQAEIKEMAEIAAGQWDDIAVAIMTSTANGFDGFPLYSASHVGGSNLWTATEIPAADVATAAAPTADEAANIIVQVIGRMQTLQNEHGSLVNKGLRGITVVTSNPVVWAAFTGAVQRSFLASGSSNPVSGLVASGYSIDVVLEGTALGATSSAVVYFFRNDSEVKPLVLIEEVPPYFDELGEGTDHAVKRDAYLFGVKTVRAGGPSAYNRAVKLTLS